SGSRSVMRPTRSRYRLNCPASPIRRARSISFLDIKLIVAVGLERPDRRYGPLGEASGSGLGGPFATRATLVAMAFHLPCELVRDEVDGVLEIGRRLPSAQCHALQAEGRLGDLRVDHRAVLLLDQLHVEL